MTEQVDEAQEKCRNEIKILKKRKKYTQLILFD